MIKAHFPFRCGYNVTQTYSQNANNYPEGHHGALDIVPVDVHGISFPAPIYPMFNGSEISIQDTDPVKGKGVRERVKLDDNFIAYLKDKNCLNSSNWPIDKSKIYLDILYWHMLDVTDTDGTASLGTQLGLCGNTGDVYSGGVPVPDNQKGKPPYPGLHLHLETAIWTDSQQYNGYLNLDKDSRGRIDPMIIINYKGSMTVGFRTQTDPTVYVAVGSVLIPLADWQAFLTIGGSDASVVVLPDAELNKFTMGQHTLFKSN